MFEVRVPPYEEPAAPCPAVSPAQQAEALSYFKARSVAATLEQGLVLGADTVVAYRGRVFGKPADAADARRILQTLAGTTHEVITGIALVDAATGRRRIGHDVTRVTMKAMTPAELQAYLASGRWQGKAGAYGIQDHDDAFIERIAGSFSNVVGLPMELLARMLDEFGRTSVDAPDRAGTAPDRAAEEPGTRWIADRKRPDPP